MLLNLQFLLRCHFRLPFQAASRGLFSVNANRLHIDDTPPIMLSIEGNIGSGKSTFLSHLKECQPEWTYIDEPLNVWSSMKNSDGQSLFQAYYADKSRWSFTFQTCALLSRFESFEKALVQPEGDQRSVFVSERCLQSDAHIFAELLHTMGHISKLEKSVYDGYFKHFRENSLPLQGVVYFSTSPIECYERIQRRARSAESSISLDYLEKVDSATKKWLSSIQVPILQLTSDMSAKDAAKLAKCFGNNINLGIK